MDAFDYVFSNNIGSLKEYLENGEINVQNERGLSLLHYAIIFNNIEIFELLLENFIDVNIQDKYGDTPLHYCVINDRIGFAKSLIRHKANINIRNFDGQTVLYKACLLGRENIIYLLLENQKFNIYDRDLKEETIFMALIRSHNFSLIKKIKLNEEIVNSKNYFGDTPLHIAAKNCDLEIIDYLLRNNAFVNSKNKMLETPIFYSVRNHDLGAINLFIKAGAILECKSSFGNNIFNMISSTEMLEYIKEKIELYKYNLYSTNYPLHYAIIVENLNSVKKYAELRNLHRKDNFGNKPLDLAKKVNNHKILMLIEQKL